ncbi:peptidylprolyl isomerase [Pseudomonas sp. AM14(2022)]|uniref:peptidylprolyl isomerase n=1 Tax=Pseudomonas sp. AM14(2022) TaxID=2983371 RepID=UPI002E80F95A|nr:peptidylprolyl isomerase [Pseudomonas sp. AM14(2022)]
MADIKEPENTIVMETTKGTVFIELFPDIAPKHVDRIKKLTRERFYDGCTFHRVIEGFMAQTGDRSGTGREGSSHGSLKSEFSNNQHLRGTCSMARGNNLDSADSQFFICFGDCPFLNGQYTVWGQVIEGMESIDRLKRGEPARDPDKIISMKVVADVN